MPVFPLYVFSMLLFGLNGIIAAAIPFESAVIVLLRLVLGGGFLALLLLIIKARAGGSAPAISKSARRMLVLSGLSMGASWLCLYAGYAAIGVGMTTLLYYTGPVMLMSWLTLTGSDRFTPRQWLGLAAAAAGAALAAGAGDVAVSATGLLIGLLSAATYAGMVYFARRAGEVDGMSAAVTEIGAAFPLVLVYALATDVDFPTLEAFASALLPVLALGLLNTGVGCAIYFWAIPRLNASVVSAASYLEPISAIVFAAVFLNESLGLAGWSGAALVLAGTMLAAKH